VCEVTDHDIVGTCLRELHEEIGGLAGGGESSSDNDQGQMSNWDDVISDEDSLSGQNLASSGVLRRGNNGIQVLGVFRCNWGEVHHLVGVAVTPVVCFLGELPDKLFPNPSEVATAFTVTLESLCTKSYWVHRDGLAPIFLGGPEPVWGLTGYILERFTKDILLPNSSNRVTRGSQEIRDEPV
jgi:hypothetical protein